MSRRLARGVRRIVLHAGSTPFRAAGPLLYLLAARTLGRLLGGGRGAALYARGSLAARDVRAGWSDLDLALVLPSRRARVDRRRRLLVRGIPVVENLTDIAVYDRAELAAVATATTFCAPHAVHLDPAAPADEAGLSTRPGLGVATAEWRRLRGPELRPAAPELSRDARLLAAWLELQAVWRGAFRVCGSPGLEDAPFAAFKLVADAARIWLWLEDGSAPARRRDTLQLAAQRLPEEAPAFAELLALDRELHAGMAPAFDAVLPPFVRLSRRIAEHVGAAAAEVPSVEVALDAGGALAVSADATRAIAGLAGAADPVRLLPLADWRARVWPISPDEAMAAIDLDPTDAAALGAAVAAAGEWGPYPAMRRDDLLVLPGPGLLRAVQCQASDPVSFALLAGESHARFSSVAGWAAADCARRAVVEHRAWLGVTGGGEAPWLARWMGAQERTSAADGKAPGLLLTAAQAALFARSVAEGEPRLAVTMEAVAQTLDAETNPDGGLASEVFEQRREQRLGGPPPTRRAVAALRERVLALDVYRSVS